MAKQLKYDGLSVSELSQLTRDRGLGKPEVLNAGEWAAWLREQDNAPAKANKPAPQNVMTPAVETQFDDDDASGDDSDAPDFDTMTKAQLQHYAAMNNIRLGDAKSNADIIAAIRAAESK